MPAKSPAPTVTTEWMASVDRAWLQMDAPGNPMVVSALIHLEDVADLAALSDELCRRLLQHPRFSQCADDRHAPARWRPCENFEPRQHLRVHTLPGHAPVSELRRAIADELVQTLDPQRPLWHLTLFPRPHHKLSLLFRAHHAMGDGIGFMQLLLELRDASVVQRPLSAAARRADGERHGPLAPLILKLSAIDAALQLLDQKWRWSRRHPAEALQQLRAGLDAGAAVARLLRLREETPAPLRHRLSGVREVAWSKTVSLAPLKACARQHGVKLNDVLLAALAGAFARHLRAGTQGLDTSTPMRVSIPVNLRQTTDSMLGNHFGLVLFELPIGVHDPQQRLHAVADAMTRLKASAEARAILGSLALAGTLPAAIERRLVEWVAGKACAVVSNLHGPDQPLQIAGARISGMLFWPPQTAGIGLGVSLLSYAGQLSLGISADRAVIRDPQTVADHFVDELALLAGTEITALSPRADAPVAPARSGTRRRRTPRLKQ